jgi:hypothetical protein
MHMGSRTSNPVEHPDAATPVPQRGVLEKGIRCVNVATTADHPESLMPLEKEALSARDDPLAVARTSRAVIVPTGIPS